MFFHFGEIGELPDTFYLCLFSLNRVDVALISEMRYNSCNRVI